MSDKIWLWLDDMRPAPPFFSAHAKTVEEAKRILGEGNVEFASLDHDLGACEECVAAGLHVGDMKTPETTFCNWCSHAQTGYDLCVWMAETGNWPQRKPVVHSMNPVGGERMRGVIDRYFEEQA